MLLSLWDGQSRVSYEAFLRGLESRRQARRHPSGSTDLPKPSRSTYGRLWQEFRRRHRIRKLPRARLLRVLLDGIAEGVWDPAGPRPSDLPRVRTFLARRRVLPPSPSVLLRDLRTAGRRARKLEVDREFVGQVARATRSRRPLSQKVSAARVVLRFLPVSHGKVGVPKMAHESTVRQAIETAIAARGGSLEKLRTRPGLSEALHFIESQPHSVLRRRSAFKVLRVLPLYWTLRHQQAVDAILFVFCRLCRCLQERLGGAYDEELDDSSRAFFERRGDELGPLRRAALETIEGGSPQGLRRFRALLKELEAQGKEVRSQAGYFDLVARHGYSTRKISPHLQGMPLEGKDPNARAVVEVLSEVHRFAPFKESVPLPIRRKLSFLEVSQEQLRSRRVFEVVVLTTLADLLWVGRVVSPVADRFSDQWRKVEGMRDGGPGDLRGVPLRVRTELRYAWELLAEKAATTDVIRNGRLVARKARRKWSRKEEERNRRAQQNFVRQVPPISIVDVPWEVNRSTGMLEAFQPPSTARHRLPDTQRLHLAIAVVVGRGMNVGVEQMSTLLGPEITTGRLWNLDANYVTVEALEQANRIVVEEYERRGLGRAWGTGEGVTGDGRSVEASEKNVDSASHFRHRSFGVTLAWLVRDDWISPRVVVISNHAFESWFLLDGMLSPFGGREPEWVAGDTHGQQLALWGLSCLMGKRLLARFRGLGKVKLYAEGATEDLPVDGVDRIRWEMVERALPSLARLVEAIRSGRMKAEDVLRTPNVYDEEGVNVAEALRELGKAVRTAYVLRYACDEDLRQQVREACTRVETWNSFQEAIFWGHGGRLKTTDAEQRRINALCMQLLMNSIVFLNAERHGRLLRRIPGATPVMWKHIRMLGRYDLPSRRG